MCSIPLGAEVEEEALDGTECSGLQVKSLSLAIATRVSPKRKIFSILGFSEGWGRLAK